MCNEYTLNRLNEAWDENNAYWQMYNTMLPVYESQIKESFDWKQIDQFCDDNLEPDLDNFNDGLVGRVFLGTVFALYPSGKYSTFWTNNKSNTEKAKDMAWLDALETVAGDYNLYIESGEFDPCDLFVVSYR